jgi:hypothetical protein
MSTQKGKMLIQNTLGDKCTSWSQVSMSDNLRGKVSLLEHYG